MPKGTKRNQRPQSDSGGGVIVRRRRALKLTQSTQQDPPATPPPPPPPAPLPRRADVAADGYLGAAGSPSPGYLAAAASPSPGHLSAALNQSQDQDEEEASPSLWPVDSSPQRAAAPRRLGVPALEPASDVMPPPPPQQPPQQPHADPTRSPAGYADDSQAAVPMSQEVYWDEDTSGRAVHTHHTSEPTHHQQDLFSYWASKTESDTTQGAAGQPALQPLTQGEVPDGGGGGGGSGGGGGAVDRDAEADRRRMREHLAQVQGLLGAPAPQEPVAVAEDMMVTDSGGDARLELEEEGGNLEGARAEAVGPGTTARSATAGVPVGAPPPSAVLSMSSPLFPANAAAATPAMPLPAERRHEGPAAISYSGTKASDSPANSAAMMLAQADGGGSIAVQRQVEWGAATGVEPGEGGGGGGPATAAEPPAGVAASLRATDLDGLREGGWGDASASALASASASTSSAAGAAAEPTLPGGNMVQQQQQQQQQRQRQRQQQQQQQAERASIAQMKRREDRGSGGRTEEEGGTEKRTGSRRAQGACPSANSRSVRTSSSSNGGHGVAAGCGLVAAAASAVITAVMAMIWPVLQ